MFEAQYNLQQEENQAAEQQFDEQKLVAESIYIQVPECGIEGWARVLGIGKCPQISPRPGPEFQLITATFKHQAKQILDVHLHVTNETLGTTPNHPFWSEDQQKFIRADELQPGEQLQKADGSITTVTQIVPRSGANTVYNLEVQLNHTYHVGNSGVLVHNGNTCKPVLIGEYMPRVRSAAENNGFRAWPARNWKSWIKRGIESKKNARWMQDQINSAAEIYSLGKTQGFERGEYFRKEVGILISNGYRRRSAGMINVPGFGEVILYKWIIP